MSKIPQKLIPVNMEELRAKSEQETLTKIKSLMDEGYSPEEVSKKLGVNVKQAFEVDAAMKQGSKRIVDPNSDRLAITPPNKVREENTEESAGPDLAIPDSFNATQSHPIDDRKEHPILRKLRKDFGIEKIKCKEIELGGYVWTFRPPNFASYEWTSTEIKFTQDGDVSSPSLQIANVVSHLAAIDGTPIYEIFDIDTTGRYIADPMKPPPDILKAASLSVLDWLRHEIGIWELIPELDRQYSNIFTKERVDKYPLLQRLLGRIPPEISMTETQNGKNGDDV